MEKLMEIAPAEERAGESRFVVWDVLSMGEANCSNTSVPLDAPCARTVSVGLSS
jgi:hypothetical protein